MQQAKENEMNHHLLKIKQKIAKGELKVAYHRFEEHNIFTLNGLVNLPLEVERLLIDEIIKIGKELNNK